MNRGKFLLMLSLLGGLTTLILIQGVLASGPRAPAACVPGPHSGHITADETWCLSDSPHDLSDNVTVDPGVTLVIEPGVMVRGADDKSLKVQGHLEAVGTPTQPITFTSIANTWEPARWSGLIFDGSQGEGTGNLRYAVVMHSGDAVYYNLPGVENYWGGNIYVRDVLSGEVHIEDTQIISAAFGFGTLHGSDYGLFVDNSRVIISGTLFSEIGDGQTSTGTDDDYPIHIRGASSVVTLTNTAFDDNHHDRVLLWPDAMTAHDITLYAQPTLESYELQGDLTIPPTYTLTIEPGVTVMGRWEAELGIEGHLEAVGSPAQPITFTSAANSGGYQWSGLVFDGGSGDLSYVTVRYGGQPNSVLSDNGANITARDVLSRELTLRNASIESEFYFWGGYRTAPDYGLYAQNSHVIISNTLFTENGDDDYRHADGGLYVNGESVVLVSNSLFQTNQGTGLIVDSDDAFVRVTNSEFTANVIDGVRNNGNATVILGGEEAQSNSLYDNAGYGANQAGATGQIIATSDWWGDASGPTHSSNPGGTGEEITDRVIYAPWLEEPPAPLTTTQQLVWLISPQHVSPGEVTNLGIYLQNRLTETLENAVLIVRLPHEADYLQSTSGGGYWPNRHEVVWQLGDVASGASMDFGVQLRFHWGLAPHLHTSFQALLASDNLPSDAIDLTEYQHFTAPLIVARQTMTADEITATLQGDADLMALYQRALDEGFTFYGSAISQTLNLGQRSVTLALLDRDRPQEVMLVHRVDDRRMLIHITNDAVSAYDLDKGWMRNVETADWDFWGDWDSTQPFGPTRPCVGLSCEDPSFGKCYRNCIISNLPGWVLGNAISLLGSAQSAAACHSCMKYGGVSECQACSAALAEIATGLNGIGVGMDLLQCYNDCMDPDKRGDYVCSQDRTECVTAGFWGALGVRTLRTYTCDTVYCTYLWGYEDTVCASGQSCEECCAMWQKNCEPPSCQNHGTCPTDDTEVVIAGDPNEMYGPLKVIPGEWMTYTIAYENVGEGTAYGVYVESTLPAEVDDSTLSIGGNGIYFPDNHVIVWQVGELAAGASGSVTCTVQVPASAVSGTVLAAQAVVYFPSVPETTPTNPVVTLVQDIAAQEQEVETEENVPVEITLGSSSPAGASLTYTVTTQPSNGALSGNPPDLTYTPDENFEGMDSFEFTVSDGTHTSYPARVVITVRTGNESEPPNIVMTSPREDENEVRVSETPLYEDVYRPGILAYADEPLNASTITTATVALQAEDGSRPQIELSYDEYRHAILILLHEPLRRNTVYRVTIGAGVQDTSGNALGEDYTWQFATWSFKVYLPFIAR